MLISIQPQYVKKILTGEKRWEFRRSWPKEPIGALLIYSTAPTKRIAAFIEVGEVVRASKSRLWEVGGKQGGISRRALFGYLDGKEQAACIELKRLIRFGDGIEPRQLFGKDFHAPQSFRYLKDDEIARVVSLIGGGRWE